MNNTRVRTHACVHARMCSRWVTWGKKPPWGKKPSLDIQKSKLDRKAYIITLRAAPNGFFLTTLAIADITRMSGNFSFHFYHYSL